MRKSKHEQTKALIQDLQKIQFEAYQHTMHLEWPEMLSLGAFTTMVNELGIIYSQSI